MSRSPAFEMFLVNETGLKFAGFDLDPPLWIGVASSRCLGLPLFQMNALET